MLDLFVQIDTIEFSQLANPDHAPFWAPGRRGSSPSKVRHEHRQCLRAAAAVSITDLPGAKANGERTTRQGVADG